MNNSKTKSKESCMVSFQRLHSHLKRLSNNDLKGSRTENGFGRMFATLFGQDFKIFTGTMFLNMDQLQKQLDNNEFQEIGSMASFKTDADDNGKVDMSKQLDASSVIIKSNGTESQKQDTSSRSGNDADIIPLYDEEPMAEVQMTADDNVSATRTMHTSNLIPNNVGEVDQNADQCYDTRPLPTKLTDNRTTELSNQLLESINVFLKKTVLRIGSSDTPSVALSNFDYIPDFTMNLASVSKICDSEFDVKFSISDCSKYDRKTPEVVGIGHRQGDLYVLDHFRVNHDTASSSVDVSSFWLNR
ncbi:hypothetical protein Tco_1531650 [Tanacetum coccineum]